MNYKFILATVFQCEMSYFTTAFSLPETSEIFIVRVANKKQALGKDLALRPALLIALSLTILFSLFSTLRNRQCSEELLSLF